MWIQQTVNTCIMICNIAVIRAIVIHHDPKDWLLPNICSSITVRVNITIFFYNVRTTNTIQQVTVCAWNVHQELWHKHEDEYATAWLRYRWCADRVHPTWWQYVFAAHWCPSRDVCIPSPASPTRFCSLPDQGPDCSRWPKCWWYEVRRLL